MKSTLAAVIIAFAVGALVTRLWWSPAEPRATVEPDRSATPVMAGERTASTPLTQPTSVAVDHSEELTRLTGLVEEILARLDDLEGKLTGIDRRPVSSADTAASDDLRGLVENVLAEADARDERLEEQRRAEAKRLDEEHFEAEIRFQIGVGTAELARELNLMPEQRTELTEALIALEIARRDMQRDLDPMTSDPETWQARFEGLENEFWARLDRTLGPALTDKLREHF